MPDKSGKHPPQKGTGRRPTREEALIWQAATRDDTPLPGRRIHIPTPDISPSPDAGTLTPAVESDITQETPPTSPAPPTAPAFDLTDGGIDRRQMDRLRNGKITIDVRLDLHGMTRVEARIALDTCVADTLAHGQRCMLVITGKGERMQGVLRQSLPGFLRESPHAAHILAVTHAPQHLGGEGAWLVLLRKPKHTGR